MILLLIKLVKPSTFKISLLVSLVIFSVFLLKEEQNWNFGLLDQMELKALDFKFKSRGVIPPNGQVAIAAIDEKSIERYGRWPWNRIVMAQLIAKLTQSGASVIAFDVGFSDEDPTQFPKVVTAIADEIDSIDVPDCKDCEKFREAVLGFLKDEIKASDPDKVLAQTIATAGNVVLGFWIFDDASEIGQLNTKRLDQSLERLLPSKINLIKEWDKDEASNYKIIMPKGLAAGSPLPIFCKATDDFGHFSFKQDEDGAMRWADLVKEVYDKQNDIKFILPSLSLKAAAKYLNSEIVLHTYPKGIDQISLGLGENDPSIQTNYMGRLLINYHGREKTFPTFSIADILEDNFEENAFKGKIVLVGATATAIYDLRVTPFQEDFPGVEIHANVIDNILNNNYIQHPDWAFYYELFIILFFGVLFGLVLGRLPALWGALFIVFVLSAYYLTDKLFFFEKGYWVQTVLPMTEALFLFLICYVYRYVTEEREKKLTRNAFKQYLNESVINVLMNDYKRLQLGGEKRNISVLFSDIRGFTTVSEKMSPEELGHILTEYMNPMTQIVFDNQGVLDKYMGDAIMAFWGAPHPQPDHPALACSTALKMMKELEDLNKIWKKRNNPPLGIGIGINTGQMWVGNMGSDVRFDYTVIGDAVNLGSRLEGTNKQYGTSIIISEYTYNEVKDHFLCRELDSIRVKGKNEPVTIYELLTEDKEDPLFNALVRRFVDGLKMYRNMQFEEALQVFEELHKDFINDGPSKVFLDRCKEYVQNPPPRGWDGVYIMTSK